MSVNSKMTALADEIRELSGTTSSKSIDAMTADVQAANTDINEQADLIAQIATALEGKAGGGVDLPPLSNPASASDILSGKEAIDEAGNVVTGTIATKTATDLTASGATVTVPAGYYASQATKSVSTGSAKTPATTITKNPTISVDSSGKITASVSGTQNVTPTVSAGYVSSGTAGTITVSGSATKQLTTQAAKTVTPSTSSQTAVAKDVYTTGAVTVAAIPSTYIQPSGTKTITTNGTHDVKSYASATVNVAGEDVTEETNAYTSKIASLESAVSALETELAGKASGAGGSTSLIRVTNNSNSTGLFTYINADGEHGLADPGDTVDVLNSTIYITGGNIYELISGSVLDPVYLGSYTVLSITSNTAQFYISEHSIGGAD